MNIASASLKLSRIKTLKSILGGTINYFYFHFGKNYDVYIGWGYSAYSKKALYYAQKYNKPFIYLEDGFMRSPFVSSISKIPYGIVQDTKAPYYDANIVTDLEELICQTKLTDTQRALSQQAIDYFIHNNLGKFSITNDKNIQAIPENFSQGDILLIDQVQGDLSLSYGGVTNSTAQQAYDYLKMHFPHKKIYLKLHPEVLAGKKQGCFDFIHKESHVMCVTECDLQTLLNIKPKVFVLTSLAGFEALLYGCDVTTFGLPWYAGYGLTNDCHHDADKLALRRKKVDLQTLFYVAYVEYTTYCDPVTDKKIDIFTMMHLCARIKKHILQLQGHIIALGIRPWKKKDFYPWVKTPYNQVSYCNTYKQIACYLNNQNNNHFKIVVWGYKHTGIIEKIKKTYPNIAIIRVEDGFIRSYGLGSDFFPALSLCFDTQELYFYKANERKSDFHALLHKAPFNQKQTKRAYQLKELIIQHRISKYNIEKPTTIDVPSDKHIIFVAGQVTGDASLRYGNLDMHLQDDYGLLQQVRKDFPQSYVLYKPHPDVIFGNRKQGDNQEKCVDLCDKLIMNASIIDCIAISHQIVTLTSQVGFDALIRDKKVYCYGDSFYRNYGLCDNDVKSEKIMHLNDFIYAALIDYPIYNYKGHFISPESAIDIILQQKNKTKNIWRSIIIDSVILRYLYKMKKWIIG